MMIKVQLINSGDANWIRKSSWEMEFFHLSLRICFLNLLKKNLLALIFDWRSAIRRSLFLFSLHTLKVSILGNRAWARVWSWMKPWYGRWASQPPHLPHRCDVVTCYIKDILRWSPHNNDILKQVILLNSLISFIPLVSTGGCGLVSAFPKNYRAVVPLINFHMADAMALHPSSLFQLHTLSWYWFNSLTIFVWQKYWNKKIELLCIGK